MVTVQDAFGGVFFMDSTDLTASTCPSLYLVQLLKRMYAVGSIPIPILAAFVRARTPSPVVWLPTPLARGLVLLMVEMVLLVVSTPLSLFTALLRAESSGPLCSLEFLSAVLAIHVGVCPVPSVYQCGGLGISFGHRKLEGTVWTRDKPDRGWGVDDAATPVQPRTVQHSLRLDLLLPLLSVA